MATTHQVLSKLKKSLRPYYNRIRYTENYKKLNKAWLYLARPLIWRYHSRSIRNLISQDVFREVRTFCIFIGHPRSGHTIIGSLLDAHPDIILSDELDALKYVDAGFSREQIFHFILKRSRSLTGRKKSGRHGKQHLYLVPGQYQGRYEKIRVIGDKRGGSTTVRLSSKPKLFQQLRDTAETEVKVILVTRNPYDNITTMFLRDDKPLTYMIENYFSACHTIHDIRQRIPDSDMFCVRHEAFVEEPSKYLHDICHFLGVETTADYLNACAGIVYKSPVKSRHETEWPPHLVDAVKARIAQFDFLEGYSYEN